MVDINNATCYMFADSYSGSGDWLDEAGSNDAALVNSPAHTSGPGGYFTLNGTNERFDISNHADITPSTSSYTVGMGLYLDSGGSGTDTVWSKYDGAGKGYIADYDNSSRIRGHSGDGTLKFDDTSAPSEDTNITYIMRVDKVADELESFLNGVGTGSPDDITGIGSVDNSDTLSLGFFGAAYMKGRIFSFAFIKSALTGGEIGTGVGTLHYQLLNQTTAGASGFTGHWGTRVAAWVMAGTSGLWLPDTASDLLDML